MKRKSLNVKQVAKKELLSHIKDKKINKIYKEFESFLNQTKSDSFLVSVSGGADSLALSYLAKCYGILNKKKISFVHFNHNLRKNSLEEAKKVKKVLKTYKMNCQIFNWKKKGSKNLMSSARNFRYDMINKVLKTKKINCVLIGHHEDDFYENFFIRLFRGSGLKGLISFANMSISNDKGYNILRPLLNQSKKNLIHISNKVFNYYINDPTNFDNNFLRSRVRKQIQVFKKEGLNLKKFRQTMDNLASANSSIDAFVDQNFNSNCKFFDKNKRCIVNSRFFSQPQEISMRSMSLILQKIGRKSYPVRGKSLNNLLTNLFKKNFKKATLSGCVIEKVENSVIINPEIVKIS